MSVIERKIRAFYSVLRDMMIPRRQSRRQILRNLGLTVITLGTASMVCIVLNSIGESENAVPLVFVLAVLMTARLTDGYAYSLLASVASVIGVNYVFTYPYFEFNFTITGYPLTFLAMFSVSAVVGMLTEQVKRASRVQADAEKEKMKANLLRSVSHDLRTPLTSIIGSSSAVLENWDSFSDDVKKDLIADVRDDAQWLVRLVENILSITRIKEGAVQIRKNLEAAEEIVAEAVSSFSKRFPELRVSVSVPDELLFVPMDATLIEQVIINLLENVALHAKGATQVVVRVYSRRDMAVFSVTDNGAGIEEQVIGRLFEEMFPHASEANADGRRSMGIGLSACMAVVRAHGGTMKAKNLPEGGACVSFELPLKEE